MHRYRLGLLLPATATRFLVRRYSEDIPPEVEVLTTEDVSAVDVDVEEDLDHDADTDPDLDDGFGFGQSRVRQVNEAEILDSYDDEASFAGKANEHLGELEIEIVSEEDMQQEGGQATSFEDITQIDTFARAKVAQFIKKRGGDISFEVTTMQSGSSPNTFYQAKLTLPLPSEYGPRVAEGVARNEKDAEAVAAMHAQNIIDILGFALYALPTTQRRHAETCRAQGRWAPMPEDAPQDPSIKSPPALRYVDDETTVGEAPEPVQPQAQVTKVLPSSSAPGTVGFSVHTLMSPNYLDAGAIIRIKQFFEGRKWNFTRCIKVTQVTSVTRRGYFCVAKLKLPFPSEFGERVAEGRVNIDTKNPHHTSITMACMHAELIIDAIGAELYPDDHDLQKKHAAECEKVGRWATDPGDRHVAKYRHPSPVPMELGHWSEDVKTGDSKFEANKREREKIIRRQLCAVTTTTFLDATAVEAYQSYHVRNGGSMEDFVVDKMGRKEFLTHRSTVVVPLPNRDELISSSSKGTSTRMLVAIGLGTTHHNSQIMCCMHALQILGSLNISVFEDLEEQRRFKAHMIQNSGTAAEPGTSANFDLLHHDSYATPPPLRHTRNWSLFKGRMTVYVSKFEKIRDGEKIKKGRFSSVVDRQLISKSQRDGNRFKWDLTADSEDGFILISPSQTPEAASSNLHTMASPRLLDPDSRLRLIDYMERHGVRSRDAFEDFTREDSDKTSVLERLRGRSGSTKVLTDEAEGDKVVRGVRLKLPVPAQFGERIAYGEAYGSAYAATLACCQHAELILDSLGIPLYDHHIIQKRHTTMAGEAGRFAPATASDITDGTAPSPPPIRVEREGSPTWEAYLAQGGKDWAVSSKESGQQDSSPSSDANEESRENIKNEATKAALAENVFGVYTEAPSNVDVSTLQKTNPKFWDNSVARRVAGYFGRNQSRISLVESTFDAKSGLHISVLAVPVPPRYGKRFAIGAGKGKKAANNACYLNAQAILDALGIQSSTNTINQKKHVETARAQGRWAPTPRDRPKPWSTPSPQGFLFDYNFVPEWPVPPETDDASMALSEWKPYMDQVEQYLETAALSLLDKQTEKNRPPRLGEPLEDKLLTIAEALPLDGGINNRLATECKNAGLEQPDPPSWRWELLGLKTDNKRYYMATPVLGTPFMARGIANTGADMLSQQKAALHYYQIVSELSKGWKLGYNAGERVPKYELLWNPDKREYTARGKKQLLELYSFSLGNGMLKEKTKEKEIPETYKGSTKPKPDGKLVPHVTVSLTHEDRRKEKFYSKGEHSHEKGAKLRAARKSYSDLFTQLMNKKQPFMALTKLVVEYPKVQAAYCYRVALSSNQEREALAVATKAIAAMKNSVESLVVENPQRALERTLGGSLHIFVENKGLNPQDVLSLDVRMQLRWLSFQGLRARTTATVPTNTLASVNEFSRQMLRLCEELERVGSLVPKSMIFHVAKLLLTSIPLQTLDAVLTWVACVTMRNCMTEDEAVEFSFAFDKLCPLQMIHQLRKLHAELEILTLQTDSVKVKEHIRKFIAQLVGHTRFGSGELTDSQVVEKMHQYFDMVSRSKKTLHKILCGLGVAQQDSVLNLDAYFGDNSKLGSELADSKEMVLVTLAMGIGPKGLLRVEQSPTTGLRVFRVPVGAECQEFKGVFGPFSGKDIAYEFGSDEPHLLNVDLEDTESDDVKELRAARKVKATESPPIDEAPSQLAYSLGGDGYCFTASPAVVVLGTPPDVLLHHQDCDALLVDRGWVTFIGLPSPTLECYKKIGLALWQHTWAMCPIGQDLARQVQILVRGGHGDTVLEPQIQATTPPTASTGAGKKKPGFGIPLRPAAVVAPQVPVPSGVLLIGKTTDEVVGNVSLAGTRELRRGILRVKPIPSCW